MQESSVSGTVSETLDSTKKYPHFHGSRERNLHSYLRHLLAESLIFLRDILARQSESENRNPETKETNPEIRINRRYWYYSILLIYGSLSKLPGRDLTRSRLDDDFSLYWLIHISLDEEEWEEYHRDTESEDSPFPDLAPYNSRIEYPTNNTNKWEEVENIDEALGNTTVVPVCLRYSEGDDEEEDDRESRSDKSNSSIRRLRTKSIDEFEHREILNQGEYKKKKF